MTPARRIALLAAVVVIAVVAFIVLKPSDDSDNKSSTSASTGTTTGKGGKPAKPVIPQVVVRNAKPLGGIKQLTFGKGDRVQFVVVSDVPDEVHVHGYDLMKDVKPGHPVKFAFPGKIDGEFEIELEGRKQQIASLKVTP